jgi:hypothetical protein
MKAESVFDYDGLFGVAMHRRSVPPAVAGGFLATIRPARLKQAVLTCVLRCVSAVNRISIMTGTVLLQTELILSYSPRALITFLQSFLQEGFGAPGRSFPD